MGALIMIVEDEVDMAEITAAYLKREGFRCVHAVNGSTAIDFHIMLKPDLVLLDITMPGMDGWQVLAEIRRRGETPVMMVTALDKDIDKLQALRLGADDYIVKPFNQVEVVARVKAVLRRTEAKPANDILTVGSLRIDTSGHFVKTVSDSNERVIPLTLTEFRILAHMARRPLRVFLRAELVDACLTGNSALDRTVDSHVSNLRRKIEEAGISGMMQSVRGVGYRLVRPS